MAQNSTKNFQLTAPAVHLASTGAAQNTYSQGSPNVHNSGKRILINPPTSASLVISSLTRSPIIEEPNEVLNCEELPIVKKLRLELCKTKEKLAKKIEKVNVLNSGSAITEEIENCQAYFSEA